MNEQEDNGQSKAPQSLDEILDKEDAEGEIQTAMDAALEEGYIITREQAKKMVTSFDNEQPSGDEESGND